MSALPVYLDENIDHGILPDLHRRGIAVAPAQAAGMTQVDDDAQLAYAIKSNLVPLTHNGRHFLKLHNEYLRQGRQHGGILHVPDSQGLEAPTRLARIAVRSAMLVDWLATSFPQRTVFPAWGALQREMTQGFRLPGYSDLEVRLALGQYP